MDVFDLVAKISVDTTQYEQGLSNAAEESKSTGSKIASGLKTAAKVGAAALTAVTTASVAMGKALISNANEVADYGDNIDKMSQKMGISIEAYQEWDAILQHSGTSMDSMSRGMQTLQKNAVNSADKFKKLGLSQEQVASMSTEELFAATIKGLQEMGEGAERTALASDLLGGSAKELGALLNTSAEETENMRQRVHELGGVMNEASVKGAAAFKDNLQDLQTAMSGIKRGIVNEFMPGLNVLMDGFTDLIIGAEGAEEQLDEGIELIGKGIENVIPKIGTLLEKLLPRIITLGGEIIGQLAQQIPKVVVSIAKQIPTVIKSLLKAIQKMIPEIMKAGVELIQELAAGMKNGTGEFIDMVLSILNTLFDTLLENAPAIIDAGLTLLENLIMGIIDNLPKIVDTAVKMINKFLVTIAEKLPEILMKGKDMILNLVRGISENIPQIIQSIVQGITAFITTIVEHLPEILQAGIEIIIELAKGLIAAIPDLVGKIPQIIMSIVGALLDPENIGKIFDAGLEMIGELFNGLLGGDFLGALADIGKALLGAVAGALGALLELGGKIVGAIFDGIKSAWGGVVDWMESAIESLMGGDPLAKYNDPNYQAPTIEGYDEMMANHQKRHANASAKKSQAVESAGHYVPQYNTTNNTYIGGRRVDSTVYNSQAMIAMKSGGK